MEKKYKLRLILMFTILPIIMVALSVSIVLVARQVTVGTKMNVTFTSNEIDCKITGSAKYKVTGKERSYTNAKVAGSTSTSKTLTFAAGVDYNGTYSIDFEKIDIDANGEAIYAFSIENTGSKSICAKVTVGNVTNMVRNITSGEYITNTEGVSGYIIHAGQTKNFEIKLTVNDKSIDASATSDISMVLANEFPASEIAAKAVDRDGTVLAVATTGSSTIQLPTNTKTTSIDDNGTTKYFQGYIKSNSATSNLSGDDHDKNYTYSAITALPFNLILPGEEVTFTAGDIFTSYYDVDPDYEGFTFGYFIDELYGGLLFGLYSYNGYDTNIIVPTLYQGELVKCIGGLSVNSGGEIPVFISPIFAITIPNCVTSIGSRAFYGCTGLTSITIPNSVTSIGSQAFNSCTSLATITGGSEKYNVIDNCIIDATTKTLIIGCKGSVIPADGSVTSIGVCAFYECTGLTSITIPNSVTSIDNSAFYSCTSLATITGGSSRYKVAGNCIIETTTKTLITGCKGSVIPTDGSVTSIGSRAFYGCTGLTSITIPNSVTSIGSQAFNRCTGLTSITIPNSVTNIGESAFYECTGLTNITIPNSVTSIDNFAFSSCIKLTSITFEDSSNWYRTTSNSNWNNKTGGTLTDLSVPATNATYFKSTYSSNYWYKL